MIDQTQSRAAQPADLDRDERSMRVVEYVLAAMALVSALLLSLR